MTEKSETQKSDSSAIPTRHLYAIVGLVVGFVGGFGFASYLAQSAPAEAAAVGAPAPALANLVGTGRATWGPDDAAVTIVEFTDFECPFCRRYFNETYPRLRERYEGQIRYVTRNFPLSSIHPRAQKAAEAAECALDQGKYWEYHDILFQRQESLQIADLKSYASELGIAEDIFAQCLDSGQKTDLVANDLQDGWIHGVRGTPTFFVNGQILVGAQPFEVFEQVLRAAGGI